MPRAARHVRIFRFSFAAGLALAATTASGASCGDDVDRRRIACACGDVVVSSTRLREGDPVLQVPCPVDGLVVAAPPLAEEITLDLGGFVLRGSGTGTGIRIDSGGSDGALVTGGRGDERANIVGFGTGVAAQRSNALRRLERVTVRSSRHHGVLLRTRGTVLIDVESSDNGRDGLRLTGRGGRVVGALAMRNGETGIRIAASGVIVTGRSEDNRNHGVVAEGTAIELRDVDARGNGGRGAIVRGPRCLIGRLSSQSNLLPDILPGEGGQS